LGRLVEGPDYLARRDRLRAAQSRGPTMERRRELRILPTGALPARSR
jgi:hypothetical protein